MLKLLEILLSKVIFCRCSRLPSITLGLEQSAKFLIVIHQTLREVAFHKLGALLSRFGVHSPEARGMSLGVTAHAVGTSVALQESDECGAFAALAMSLMGVATAVFLPLAVSLVA